MVAVVLFAGALTRRISCQNPPLIAGDQAEAATKPDRKNPGNIATRVLVRLHSDCYGITFYHGKVRLPFSHDSSRFLTPYCNGRQMKQYGLTSCPSFLTPGYLF
jgi:hypothetical protein